MTLDKVSAISSHAPGEVSNHHCGNDVKVRTMVAGTCSRHVESVVIEARLGMKGSVIVIGSMAVF